MPKILLVDQDAFSLREVCDWLESRHCTVEIATSNAAAQKLLTKYIYDVIIFDWHTSDLSTQELCRWFRTRSGSTPVLTIMDEDDDVDEVVSALSVGADDCLRKPFELRELTFRVNALRRRNVDSYSTIMQRGPLKLDPKRHVASIDNRELSLTATEFDLLEYIARNGNNVLSATVILNSVWKDAAMTTSVDTVRAYVKRLRQKLDAVGYRDLIENIHGVGYRINLSAVGPSKMVAPTILTQPVGTFY